MKILDLGTGYLAFPFAEKYPIHNENNENRFIHAYMQMKKDKDIKFYIINEWKLIGEMVRLQFIDGFETYIRFPRKRQIALGFDKIMQVFNKSVIQEYTVETATKEI